jgi:exodeoxyribonuclease X
MTAYLIDTETTDSDPEKAEVIELAIKPFDNIHKYVTGKRRFKSVRATSTYGALATHHILPEELNDCLPSSHAALPADASYIIGHNVDFDWRVLGSPPVRRICTLAMARAIWPALDSHKLGALVYFLNGVTRETKNLLQGAHSADADVDLCHIVLNGILQTCPEVGTVEQLWQFSEECRIPTVMTFGKYKGQPVEAVDRGWIGWYRRQPDTDPYLLEAFQRLGR